MSETSSNGSVYELTGPVDAPVLVFVHGLGLNRQVWAKFVARMAQRYRVLNYDLFGHGESVPPPEKPNLTTFSEQLVSLLDELGIERCSIIGFSLGGMINRRFAIDHPNRLQAMAILNSPHERGDEAQKLVEQRFSFALVRVGVVEAVAVADVVVFATDVQRLGQSRRLTERHHLVDRAVEDQRRWIVGTDVV